MIIDLEKDNEELINNLELAFPRAFSNVKIKTDFENNVFSKYFIYMEDSNIIGYINYYDLYDRFELSYIEVKEEYQNKHIGSMMLQYLIDIGNNKDIKNITLEVNINNSKAIGLYKKYSFEVVAKREKYYDGVDAYLMERKMM